MVTAFRVFLCVVKVLEYQWRPKRQAKKIPVPSNASGNWNNNQMKPNLHPNPQCPSLELLFLIAAMLLQQAFNGRHRARDQGLGYWDTSCWEPLRCLLDSSKQEFNVFEKFKLTHRSWGEGIWTFSFFGWKWFYFMKSQADAIVQNEEWDATTSFFSSWAMSGFVNYLSWMQNWLKIIIAWQFSLTWTL